MNIKFGDNNFFTRYLKRFLNSELVQTSSVLGDFDEDDLDMLVSYLNSSNVLTMFEVQNRLLEQFPDIKRLFNYVLRDNYIVFTSRDITVECSEYITQNIDSIQEYCDTFGWNISSINEWIDTNKDINSDGRIDYQDRQIIYNIVYNHQEYDEDIMRKADLNLDGVVNDEDISIFDSYVLDGKLGFTIYQGNRQNYFPNQDMLVFVNQFKGKFLYQHAILDNEEFDNVPSPDPTGLRKVAIFKCTPGEKVTIAHNNNKTTHLVIGSSTAKLEQDITSVMLRNVVEVDLKQGEGYQYTATGGDAGGYDATYICIECPSNYGNLTGSTNITYTLDTGDINFDGQIDMADYTLLARYTAEGSGDEEHPLRWDATDKQIAVMDINKDGVVDNRDTELMYRFLNHDPSITSLGVTYFDTTIPSDYNNADNVSNLLIIQGHYDKNVNIPFSEFITNDWIVHDKFFSYLFSMCITNYSNSEDISYLQKLLKEAYPEHSYDKNFFYPGFYNNNMRNIVYDYQRSKVSYTQGDLNRDNKITQADVTMLSNYLTDMSNYNLLVDYLDGKIEELTEEQRILLDKNNDGVVNEEDRIIFEKELNEDYSPIFRSRADVNQDGYVNELDLDILQKEANGETEILKQYDISFILGWCDPQTESLLENNYNVGGRISEVSK